MPSNEFTTLSYSKVVWTLLFVGMVVVAITGNLLVIWIVLTNKRMRTATNYFLVNISVAAIMMSALHTSFNFTFMLNLDWLFGHFYCKFSQFISVLSIATSVFMLLAISVDRYVAIMSPLRARLGKRATLGITAAIWGCSVFISSPTFIYFTTETYLSSEDTVSQICYVKWLYVDGITTTTETQSWIGWYMYNVVFMVLTYFVPILAMTYAYTRVGIQLWGSQSIGECTQAQLDSVKSHRSVIKMMIVVVIVYAVCWLPFNLSVFVTFHHPEVLMYKHIQEIFMAFYWLAMSNAMHNPIIYFWVNSEFWEGFKQLFSCCRAVRHDDLRMDRPSGTEGMDRSGQALPSTGKDERFKLDANIDENTHNNTMVSTV